MMYITKHGDRKISTREMAAFHNISDNHLAKVMQRLVHAGYVKSIRGPKGGFELARTAESISLSELYELFDGPVSSGSCLINGPVCSGGECVFGTLLSDLNTMVSNYMNSTHLSAVLTNSEENSN